MQNNTILGRKPFEEPPGKGGVEEREENKLSFSGRRGKFRSLTLGKNG